MTSAPDAATRGFLRHTLAVLAYRGGKALRGAPDGFSSVRAVEGSRSAGEILAHVNDLLDWMHSILQGAEAWRESRPASWQEDTARFFDGLGRVEQFLASDAPLTTPAETLFQGPVADALTHVGQIALLRRLAGGAVRAENYFKAEIVAGRVGPDQAKPRREFG